MHTSDRFRIGYSESGEFEGPAHIADTMMLRPPEYVDRDVAVRKVRDKQIPHTPSDWGIDGGGMTIEQFAAATGSDKLFFDGDCPDEICEECWEFAVAHGEKQKTPRDELDLTEIGYHFHWK